MQEKRGEFFACKHYFIIFRGTQGRFPPKYTENTFYPIQSSFRSLEMRSNRSNKNFYFFGHSR